MKVALLTSSRLNTRPGLRKYWDNRAQELRNAGWDVHILFCGETTMDVETNSTHWHEIAATSPREYSPYPRLNDCLRDSQALCERYLQLSDEESFDLIDMDLLCAGSYITLTHVCVPIVVSCSEIPAQTAADDPSSRWIHVLQQRCLKRADAILQQPDQPEFIECVESTLKERSVIMGEHAPEVYSRTLKQVSSSPQNVSTAYQVMMALDSRDAVSNIARDNAAILYELGYPDKVLAQYCCREIRDEVKEIHEVLQQPDCALMFHYWNYNPAVWLLRKVHGRKALYYHNITPLGFFSPGTKEYSESEKGYAQIAQLVNRFDLLIGVSGYNLQQLAPHLTSEKPSLIIPPVLDAQSFRNAPCDSELLSRLTADQETVHILFIGRVARNKRQEKLMTCFEHYYRAVNKKAHLWMIGNDQQDPAYRAELENLRQFMKARDHIHFTGKVSDEAMTSYLRAANVFICASEHEGFCVPLVQAMAFDIPVIAYRAAAVPETMGASGILINEWDNPRIAETIDQLMQNESWRENTLAGQRKNLERFSHGAIKERLRAATDFLCRGETHPLITPLTPKETPSIH